MKCLYLVHDNSGYANAPHLYTYIACLVSCREGQLMPAETDSTRTNMQQTSLLKIQ